MKVLHLLVYPKVVKNGRVMYDFDREPYWHEIYYPNMTTEQVREKVSEIRNLGLGFIHKFEIEEF